MTRASTAEILGVRVDAQTLDTAVDRMAGWLDAGEPNYVCVTGVHGVMASQDDRDLRRIHNEAGMVTTDGMPLVWLARRQVGNGSGREVVERVYGPDLMLATFDRSQSTGWRHFLYGSTPATLRALRENLLDRFPAAQIVGELSPPFGDLDAETDERLTAEIAAARPDLVWVGLSTPRQERWMAQHVDRIGGAVLVGVGAAFDFHAGATPQAPSWIQRSGLEWAFRMAIEPRRLTMRYLCNNPRFVWLVVQQMVRDQVADARADRPASDDVLETGKVQGETGESWTPALVRLMRTVARTPVTRLAALGCGIANRASRRVPGWFSSRRAVAADPPPERT